MLPCQLHASLRKGLFNTFLFALLLPIFGNAQPGLLATVDNNQPGIYNSFTLTVSVGNAGQTNLSDIRIYIYGCDAQGGPLFNQDFGIVYEGTPDAQPTKGSFDFVKQEWYIPSITLGEGHQLSFRLFTLTDEVRNIIVSTDPNAYLSCAGGSQTSIVEINGDGNPDQLPDLNLARLTNLPNEANQGDVVEFNFDLINSGEATAAENYTIGAYLSTDSNFGNADDIRVGEINTGQTPIGTIPDVLGAIIIPNNTPTGSYFLILVADDGGVIAETDESNNFLSGNIFVNDIIGGECTAPQITNTEVKCVTDGVTGLLIEWDAVAGAESYELELTDISTGTVINETIVGTSFLTTTFSFSANYGLELTTVCSEGERFTTSIDFGTADPTYDLFGLFTEATYFPQTNSVSAAIQVKNAGLSPTVLDIDYYLSTDNQLSSDDIFISRRTDFNLGVGCLTGRSAFIDNLFSELSPNVSSGQYFILANFDPENEIAEIDEDNNVAASFNTISIGDLGEDPTVTLSTPSTTVDGPFSVQVTFSESVTDFMLAEIEVANGTKSNPAQQSGSSYSFTVTPINPGEVTIFVPANAAFDSDGNGNQASEVLSVTFDIGTNLPDLEAAFSLITPNNPEYVEATIITEPTGNDENIPFGIHFYFSKDQTFSGDDVQAFNFFAPVSTPVFVVSAIPDEQSTFPGNGIGIPSNLPLDNYYIIGAVDPDNFFAESNENNNIFLSSQSYQLGNDEVSGIDLELDLSSSTSTPSQWETFSITSTISNTGDTPANNIEVVLAGCNDNVPTSLFVQSFGIVNANANYNASLGTYNLATQVWTIPTLAPGATATLEVDLFALTEDTKNIHAFVANADGVDSDSSPGNNNSCTVTEDDEATIELNGDGGSDGYDLEMTNLSAPQELVFNSLGAITVGTVTNIGNETSPPAAISVFFSDDDQFDPGEDRFFAEVFIEALEPGAAITDAPQQQILITEVDGRYGLNRNNPQNYWIAVVTRRSGSEESNLDNNVFALPFNLVVPDYDVVVEANTTPPTNVEAGQSYDLDLSASNAGSVNYSITIFDRGGAASSVLDIATSADLDAPAIRTLFQRSWSVLPFASPDEMLIPANLPDGDYFLRWYVATNLTEVTRTNNALIFPLTVGSGGNNDQCAFITPYRSETLNYIRSEATRDLIETDDNYTIQINLPRNFASTGSFDEYQLSLDGEVLSEAAIPNTSPYDVQLEVNDDKTVDLVFERSPDLPDGTRVPIDISYENPTDVIQGGVFKTSTGFAFSIAIIDVDEDPLLVANRIFQTDNVGQNVSFHDLPEALFFGGFGRLTEAPDGSLLTEWFTSGNFSLVGVPADGSPVWRFLVAADTPSSTWVDTRLSADGAFVYTAKTDNQQAFVSKLRISDGTRVGIDLSEMKTSSDPTGGFRQTRMNGILPTADGGLIVAVQAFEVVGPSASGTVIAQYDANDQLVWKQEFLDLPYAVGPVGQTSDGGFLFAGEDRTNISDRGSVFIKTTSIGALEPLCNPIVTQGIDLELSLSANPANPGIWNNVVITCTLTNAGTEASNDIVVQIGGCSPSDGNFFISGFEQSFELVYAHTNFPATAGSYDFLSQIWEIPTLEAGQIATLDITLFTLTTDPKDLYAAVAQASGEDIDSTPDFDPSPTNNQCAPDEDDEATITINASANAARAQDRGENILSSPLTQQTDYKIYKTFPTLSENEVTILLYSKKETIMTMKVYDMKGQEINQKQVEVVKGANRIRLDISDLSSGIHNVMFTTKKGKPVVTRFIKQRL